MSQENRDPGLQPERTSISWFRTILLILGNSLLLFMVSEHQNYLILELVAGWMLLCAIAGTFYNKQRFSRFFSNEVAVNMREILVKKILSTTIFIVSATYFSYLIRNLFAI